MSVYLTHFTHVSSLYVNQTAHFVSIYKQHLYNDQSIIGFKATNVSGVITLSGKAKQSGAGFSS
jgi:hypothetical protein